MSAAMFKATNAINLIPAQVGCLLEVLYLLSGFHVLSFVLIK